MESLGATIAENRKKLNLTQKDLGEQLNVSPQAVSKWENGQAEPDASTIRKLCQIFNISTDELLGITASCADESATTAAAAKPAAEERIVEQKIINGYCERCKEPVGPGEYVIKNLYGTGQHIFCKECDAEMTKAQKVTEHNYHKRQTVKSFIVGGIVGAVTLLIFLISVLTVHDPDLSVSDGILGSFIIGIAAFTFTTQMFWEDGAVRNMFFFFIRSFRMPGIIFSFDIGGLIFLIFGKIILAVIGVLLSIFLFIFGTIFTYFCSIVIFPFATIKRFSEAKQLKIAAEN